MEQFIKKIFVACDKDEDGYLDRCDLEDVKNQFGLDGNICEILDQFGSKESGKISYNQFYQNSAVLFGELSGSDSSPEYYSTDSDAQTLRMATEKARRCKNVVDGDEVAQKSSQTIYFEQSNFDEKLHVSEEKMKEISQCWGFGSRCHHDNSGGSGGGIKDYLDPQTLEHLEELNIIDPHMMNEKSFAAESSPHVKWKDIFSHMSEFISGKEQSGPDFMEISRQLHLAALASYRNEIFDLNTRLQGVREERDILRNEQISCKVDKQKMQHDYEEKLQSQTMRITELQSVIAELTRKLNRVNGKTIEEEEEDDDEDDDCQSGSISDLEVQGSHRASQCSCENCHHIHEDGPNQVNFLATRKETCGSNATGSCNNNQSNDDDENNDDDDENNDDDDEYNDDDDEYNNNNNNEKMCFEEKELEQQLSNVLGALESRIEERSKYSMNGNHAPRNSTQLNSDDVYNAQHCKDDAENGLLHSSLKLNGDGSMKNQISELFRQVEMLKRDKRSLEKQLHNISVQGYVYQKGNTTHVEEEFTKLRQENTYLRLKLRKAEEEVEEVKVVHIGVKDEKERLIKQKRALQERVDDKGSDPSSHTTQLSSTMHYRSQSPNIHRLHTQETRTDSLPRSNSLDSRPPPRVQSAVLVDVRPENTIRRSAHHLVETSDLGSSIGDECHRTELSRSLLHHLHGRIPDTLLQTLVTYRSLEQVLSTLVDHFITDVEEKVREGLINVERVESRLAHLQSQNDLLQLSLDESKQNGERLSLLCGKYESNSTAWSLALQNTEQLIETYEVMLQLQESEADIYSANCHVAVINNFDTIKSITSTKSSHSNISLASDSSQQLALGEEEEIVKSYHKRKDAESQARILLLRLDKKYENIIDVEELRREDESYKSRTSTGSSQTSHCTEDTLSKHEEHRLRDYIKKLKTERRIYKGTVVELESVHEYSDRHAEENINAANTQDRTHELNLDIEAAVTLQEVQALKEERAELKHRIYLVEKEKRSLELKMSSREAQEQAYIVHIEHLKSEVKEQIRTRKQLLKDGRKLMPCAFPSQDEESISTSDSAHSGPISNDVSNNQSSAEELPQHLFEAQRRERKLKTRIHELVDTLEKLSKNSEIRHKQTGEYISDLKRANGALVTAYEKAKKRHASRLKKFEQQLVQMAEKYQSQVRVLKDQINSLKETTPRSLPQPPHTETSL